MEGYTMADSANEESMKARRDELATLISKLNDEKAKYERELHAISLYLDAMKGVLPKTEPAVAVKARPDKPRQRGAGGTRAPRGERRGAILEILTKEPEGYTFDKIAEMLGVADGQEKKTVYATLHNMKRKGDIAQLPDKRFVVPPAEEEEPQPDASEAG
jgi:predicted Zn-ribbon and HTH transcriptional regulator